VEDPGRLEEALREVPVAWIDVVGVGDAATIARLGEIFGLHPLTLEDVVNVHQRAKVEDYEDHLFIVARTMGYSDHLHTEQVGMFLGRGWVLTFQERPGDCFEPVRERIRRKRGRIRAYGADYLAYALLDAIVDSYFPLVDDHGDRLEALDERIGSAGTSEALDELHVLNSDLMTLRRAIRPLRDALVRLMPDPNDLIAPETQLYLRDCYDHTMQLIDLIDNYRELVGDLREYHMSAVNTRMNEIMTVLTIIATIFIPLSFIASVYGMNFDTALPGNMPELEWPYGYVFALALMGVVALGLLSFIWRKGWLRAERPRRRRAGRPDDDDPSRPGEGGSLRREDSRARS